MDESVGFAGVEMIGLSMAHRIMQTGYEVIEFDTCSSALQPISKTG